MKTDAWKMAWNLFSRRERMMTCVMIAIAVLGAAAQVLMIGAVLPFLNILSSPEAIETSSGYHVAVDYFGIEGRYEFVLLLGVGSIAAILVASSILILKTYALARFTQMRVHSISTRLVKSYLRRDYGFFLDRSTGDIGKRILSESNEIANSFLRPAAEIVASGLAVIGIIAFLFFVEPLATILGLMVVFAVYGVIYGTTNRSLGTAGERRTAANKRRFSAISEMFGGIKEVKVSGKEDVFFRRFEDASRETVKAQIYNRLIADLPRFAVLGLFFSGIIVACLVLIDREVFERNGGVALAEIIPALGVFALAGQRLIPEVQKVYSALSRIAFGVAALRSVHEDMDRNVVRGMPVEKPVPVSFARGIVLEDVSFRYPGTEQSSLETISLSIPKGCKIGLVGGTGAGKTTLVDVLLGVLRPSSGCMKIDDSVLDTEPQWAGWRQKVAYVPQDIFLVEGTIADNIAFGIPAESIDRDRLEKVARIAQIHTVVCHDLPEGYETMVGERGVRLSGGQRQRIGIARALYRGAEMLVLDEATSALDTETEREVIQAIEALPHEVTVVMIAHRLSTLRSCDEIIVMDKGKIIEKGPRDELIAMNGTFARLKAAAE